MTKFTLIMRQGGCAAAATFEADVAWLPLDPRHAGSAENFFGDELLSLRVTSADRCLVYVPARPPRTLLERLRGVFR